MERMSLPDGTATFQVTAGTAAHASRVVLFSVGAGGNPERHAPLLEALVDAGCSVVAPHFDRLASSIPTDDELLTRARRLTLASRAVAQADLPMTGVGHSIGAAVLLALAGGHLWMRPGRPLPIAPLGCIDRLALLAPATGFFQPAGALDGVHAPLAVWAGERDTVTPPAQADFLARALADRVSVDLRIVEGAGHFTFMNVLPPHVADPLPDRLSVLERIQSDVVRFATA